MRERVILFLCPSCNERRDRGDEKRRAGFFMHLEPKSGTWYVNCLCGYMGKYDDAIIANPQPYNEPSIIGKREFVLRMARKRKRRAAAILDRQMKEIENAQRSSGNNSSFHLLGSNPVSGAKAKRF